MVFLKCNYIGSTCIYFTTILIVVIHRIANTAFKVYIFDLDDTSLCFSSNSMTCGVSVATLVDTVVETPPTCPGLKKPLFSTILVKYAADIFGVLGLSGSEKLTAYRPKCSEYPSAHSKLSRNDHAV